MIEKLLSFKNMIQKWQKLHNNLNFEFWDEQWIDIHLGDLNIELWIVYKSYAEYTNCSVAFLCQTLFRELGMSYNHPFERLHDSAEPFNYRANLFSCVHNPIEYRFQIIYHKVNYFNANSTAFGTPFEINVWVSL